MNKLDDVFSCDSEVLTFIPSGSTSKECLAVALSGLTSLINTSAINIESLKDKVESFKEDQGTSAELSTKMFITEYGELIKQSKSMIGVVTYLLNSSTTVMPETVTAASSLITSIRGLLSDIMEIYRDYTKFKQSIQLAKIKSELKKNEQTHKATLDKELLSLRNGIIEGGSDGLLDYCQSEIIERLNTPGTSST